MYNSTRVKNLELPENLFSNLGETKSRELEKKEFIPPIIENPITSDFSAPIINDLGTSIVNDFKSPITNDLEFPIINDYSHENDIKLTNYSNRQEYRERIDKMYEELKEVTPIDNEIDELLFFNNYVEKGIVVKPKVSSLKQFWTEYRLIHNEKATKPEPIKLVQEEKTEEELDSFDKLFEALSSRVTEFNRYIDELKEMKASIDKTSRKLEEDKEKLESERLEFNTYKQNEESKLNKDKENLKINFNRLQTIIDDLDKKLVSFDKEEL